MNDSARFEPLSRLTRLRYDQIRLFSKTLERLAFNGSARKLLASLGRSSRLAHVLVGFRRTFTTFAAAEQCISRYHVPSHEHPANVATHYQFSHSARTSDYPVLFHLQRFLGDVREVLDIGGSAGNLFYCYAQYLQYRSDLRWTVFEVPQNVRSGRAIATERGEQRLNFIDRLEQCTDADTVIISGSLHYFEALPSELMRHLKKTPKHVFINRTPVTDGPSAVTVQDAGTYYAMSPARILSRQTLLETMLTANYDLIDQWMVPDLKLRIPLDPGSSAPAYSGFYFRAKT